MSEERPVDTSRVSLPKIDGWELLCLTAIMLLGAVLRIDFLLKAPGFFYDEAIYALDGLRILREPGWPIFFDTNNHMREPLFIYLLAITQAIFGPGILVARGTAVLVGVLTIPAVWLLAREWRGPLFALFATLIFATLRWHVHFSGLCFRTITAPFFSALVALFLLRVLRTGRRRDAVGLGLALGIGAYSYLSFRLFPFIVAPVMGLALWRATAEERGHLGSLFAIAIGVAALVFLPLGIHFARNPDHFTGRSDEVSILSQPSLMLRQARDVALMGVLRGDHVGKHNVPGPPRFAQVAELSPKETAELWALERDAARLEGRPPLDPHGTGLPVFFPLMGLVFYLGFSVVIWRSTRDPRDATMTSWILVGSLASILSFGAPNMLRLVYLTPAVALLLTEGLRLLAMRLEKIASDVGATSDPPRAASWLAMLLIAGLLGPLCLLHLLVDLNRNSKWPTHPMVVAEFNTDLASLGAFLAAQPDRLPARLPEILAAHPTLVYTTDGLTINPPKNQLGSHWWEFQPHLAMPPVEPVPHHIPPDARRHTMALPGGLIVGELVEVVAVE